jgi:hypothetical protein
MAAGKHPNIIKKVDAGEWQSGILLGELMAFYWKKTRGLSWSEDALLNKSKYG